MSFCSNCLGNGTIKVHHGDGTTTNRTCRDCFGSGRPGMTENSTEEDE